MKNVRNESLTFKICFRSLMLAAGLCALVTLGPRSNANATQLTVNLVNNSDGEICHLYLSPADNDNWGGDQLNETKITAGSTRTLQLSWDQSTVKLVAEDQDGCFLTTTVDATGTQVWTITNNTPRDCGANLP
jgi:uncharacterized protein (DUF2141 family)